MTCEQGAKSPGGRHGSFYEGQGLRHRQGLPNASLRCELGRTRLVVGRADGSRSLAARPDRSGPAGEGAPAASRAADPQGPGARRRGDTCHGRYRPLRAHGRFEHVHAGQPVASHTTCGRLFAFTWAWGRSSGRRFPPIASGGPGVASVRLRPPGGAGEQGMSFLKALTRSVRCSIVERWEYEQAHEAIEGRSSFSNSHCRSNGCAGVRSGFRHAPEPAALEVESRGRITEADQPVFEQEAALMRSTRFSKKSGASSSRLIG